GRQVARSPASGADSGRRGRAAARPQHAILCRIGASRRRALEGLRILARPAARAGVAPLVSPRGDGPIDTESPMTKRRPMVLLAASVGLAGAALVLGTIRTPNFWSRPDRRGDRLLRAGKFDAAAKAYADPIRRGVALYRAGDFKDAAAAFATVDT